MTAIALGIFSVASLEEEARLFVALLVKVVKQSRRRVVGQLARQLINAGEQRQQTGLHHGGGHRSNLLFELGQGLEDVVFRFGHVGINSAGVRLDQVDSCGSGGVAA